MRGISYFVAVLLGVFVAACIGGICFACTSERSRTKKEKAAAEAAMEAKQALLSRG